MKKLPITTKWLRSAKLDFVKEGVFRGALAVELDFAGTHPGSLDDVELIVKTLRETPLPAKKFVRLVGAIPAADEMLLLLVKSLADYGFTVQAVVDGTFVMPWMQWLSWLVVRTSLSQVMIACDEVWYSPREDAPLVDISYPVQPQRATFLYLAPGRRDIVDVEAFIISSPKLWAML